MVELLDLCQTTEEIVSILNEETGMNLKEQSQQYLAENQNSDTPEPGLARVKLALKYEQKRVSYV